MKYFINRPIRLRLRLISEDKTPRPGSFIYCTIKSPNGKVIEISSSQIINSDIGVYSYTYKPIIAGNYYVMWYETVDSVSVIADTISFVVRRF
jgi:hypothetical protein